MGNLGNTGTGDEYNQNTLFETISELMKTVFKKEVKLRSTSKIVFYLHL